MNVINIFFASDNNYAQPMGVAIYSMLDNFHSDQYKPKITILDGGISEKNKSKLLTIGNNFQTQINFTKISNEIFKNCKYIGRYTLVAYYRLIIPNIIEKEVKKAIYLDCDILVIDNIVKLYEKNIENYIIGAVQSRNKKEKYFSSGVLLMNLEKMREEKITEKALNFAENVNQKLEYPDQDILNKVCKNQWLELENVWNFEIERSELKVTPSPAILHYITDFKPWYRFYHNYYQKYYRQYLRKWPDYKIYNPEIKTAIKQIIKYIPLTTYLTRRIKNLINP